MSLYASLTNWMQRTPNLLEKQEIYAETIEEDLWALDFVPDHYKTLVMRGEAVHKEPFLLQEIPDHLKTKEMCTEAMPKESYLLQGIPIQLKTQEMCAEAVRMGRINAICLRPS